MTKAKTSPEPEKKEEITPEPEAKITPKKEIKIETEMVKTESGIIVPETKILEKQPYFAKKYDSDSWAVYSEDGRIVKIYTQKGGGNTAEECERGANNLAKKLSNQFIAK